jgi:hypothetical protein
MNIEARKAKMINKKKLKIGYEFLMGILAVLFFTWSVLQASLSPINSEKDAAEEKISDSWMGIYMNGVKVGFSHSQEMPLEKEGESLKRSTSESWMKVSRLGGNPVEIKTWQESLHDAQGRPLKMVMKTRMSDSETVIKAEVMPDKIVFRAGDKVVKELAYEEDFYLGVPLEKIIEEQGLKKGKELDFKLLDPLSHSLTDCHFKVAGKEDVLILGKKMDLWHIKTETSFIIPIVTDEWVDEEGRIWKSESQTSFARTASIRMPKEKALQVSEENFDIAFSTIIQSNLTLENPQKIQRVTFKLNGISEERINSFPYDDGSQKILEMESHYAIIQTSSVIFDEKQAVSFPVREEKFKEFLKPTSFCQSDDPQIRETARRIIGRERNSWQAAKMIARWVKHEMTPNYDIGFATAKEILNNPQGDCSEHTVITVALCRAVGIPARAAVGIMYARGIFAYHMWPEVYAGRWVGLDAKWLAADEESGQYYTDATHIKFGRTLLDENIFKEMVQAVSEIIGKLKLEILDYQQIN